MFANWLLGLAGRLLADLVTAAIRPLVWLIHWDVGTQHVTPRGDHD